MPHLPTRDPLNIRAGNFVIFRNYGLQVREVASAGPKLLKLAGRSYPRQIKRDAVLAVFDTEAPATAIANQIREIDSEFAKIGSEARREYSERFAAARDIRDGKVTDLIAAANGGGQ